MTVYKVRNFLGLRLDLKKYRTLILLSFFLMYRIVIGVNNYSTDPIRENKKIVFSTSRIEVGSTIFVFVFTQQGTTKKCHSEFVN